MAKKKIDKKHSLCYGEKHILMKEGADKKELSFNIENVSDLLQETFSILQSQSPECKSNKVS